MDKELLSFTKVRPNQSVVDEALTFDVKKLDTLRDSTISQYVIGLGQWVIYYRAQVNETKANVTKLQIDLDFLVANWMTAEVLKEYKTQTAAREYLIRSNAESAVMFDKLQELRLELIKVEGIDKTVTELMAAYKRELTRRENELYTIRKERG